MKPPFLIVGLDVLKKKNDLARRQSNNQ